MVKIEVCIGTKSSSIDELSPVIEIFNGKSTSGNTEVSKINIIDTKKLNPNNDLDFETISEALRISDPANYLIVCKDDIIGIHSPEILLDHLECLINLQSVNKLNVFDIFYLCKWMDKCNLYYNKRDSTSFGTEFVNTPDSNGLSCLMFSPNGRAKFQRLFPITNPIPKSSGEHMKTLGHRIKSLLNQDQTKFYKSNLDISEERIFASTSKYSLVKYNQDKSTGKSDYIKTIECRENQSNQPNQENKPISSIIVPPLPNPIQSQTFQQSQQSLQQQSPPQQLSPQQLSPQQPETQQPETNSQQ